MNRSNQWKFIDNFKRKIFIKKEIKYFILKSLCKNNYCFLIYKYLFFFLKIKINSYCFKIKHNKRCLKTGRIKGIVGFIQNSRFIFRTNSYNGNLPGFKRSSW